jgi:hypothetical protein
MLRGQQLYPRRSWLAAGRGLYGLQVDPETMLMAAVELADHNTHLRLVTHRMQILYIGNRSRFERSFHQDPSVVRLDVAGLHVEEADL